MPRVRLINRASLSRMVKEHGKLGMKRAFLKDLEDYVQRLVTHTCQTSPNKLLSKSDAIRIGLHL